MPAPHRSTAQRMAALDRANEIRTGRAELKRRLKADPGLDVVIELLSADPLDSILDTMKVIELLLAVPKLGTVRARALFRESFGPHASPSRTLGGLRPGARAALVTRLEAEREHRRNHAPRTKGHA